MRELQEDFCVYDLYQKGGNEGTLVGPVHRGMTGGQTRSNILGRGTKMYINIRQEYRENFHRLMRTRKGKESEEKTEEEKKSMPVWPAPERLANTEAWS